MTDRPIHVEGAGARVNILPEQPLTDKRMLLELHLAAIATGSNDPEITEVACGCFDSIKAKLGVADRRVAELRAELTEVGNILGAPEVRVSGHTIAQRAREVMEVIRGNLAKAATLGIRPITDA